MGQKTKRNYGKMTAAVNLVKSESSGVFGVKAINKAIKLLTENGYRVSKPVLIYEEVTVK